MTTNLRATFPILFSDEITVTALTTAGHKPLTMTSDNAQLLAAEILFRLAQLPPKDV